jgi:hypothetical protein
MRGGRLEVHGSRDVFGILGRVQNPASADAFVLAN